MWPSACDVAESARGRMRRLGIVRRSAPGLSQISADLLKSVEQQQSATEMEQGDELARIKAERAALDAQYKALMAQQKAKRAVAKAAQRTKTLETVISEEETAMARWMVARLVARVNARVKAGQDRETALDAVLANFRRVLGTQLDRRAK